MEASKLEEAARRFVNNIKMSIPILTGVLLLIGLFNSPIPRNFLVGLFSGVRFLDPLIGSLFGSVATGNPLTSYIIGGELLSSGIGLAAVVAFVLSWVTVGVVQLPAESLMLGRRFALVRNSVSFVMAILIALLTVITLELIW